jgi:hypothetical protein
MTHRNQPKAIQLSDLRLLSYAELGRLLEILTENVLKVFRERNIRINAVAPILRSGAFPGCHLASKLGVLDILPLQYKHTHDRTHPIHRPYAVPTLARALDRPVILMADANAVTGEIAKCAAADIRAIWPSSTILFACVTLDVSLESIPGVDILISARRTNERRTLSHDAAARNGISGAVYVFPWEEIKEQWAEIQAAQFTSEPEGRNENDVAIS